MNQSWHVWHWQMHKASHLHKDGGLVVSLLRLSNRPNDLNGLQSSLKMCTARSGFTGLMSAFFNERISNVIVSYTVLPRQQTT